MRAVAARRSCQTSCGTNPKVCEGSCSPSGRKRRNLSLKKLHCPGNSASPCFAASCCRDGSLAVIQPIWVQEASEVPPMSAEVATALTCAHSMSNASTSLRRNCNTTRPSQSSSLAASILILLGTYMRPLEFLALRNKDLVQFVPCWSNVIAASEAEYLPRQGSAVGQSTSSWPWSQHVTMEPPTIGYKVSKQCKTCEYLCTVSQDTTCMGSRLAADHRSLPLTLRNKLETIARHAEGWLIGRLRINQLTNA